MEQEQGHAGVSQSETAGARDSGAGGTGAGGTRVGTGTNGGGGGGGKGCFGCLGCVGIAVLVLILVPVVLGVVAWFMLPTIVAPEDTDWVMVAPDSVQVAEIRESVESEMAGLDSGERVVIELDEDELNQLLATAIAEGFAAGTDPSEQDEPAAEAVEELDEGSTHARFRMEGDAIHLDVRTTIPEGAVGLPSRLRGEPTGIQLALVPRAEADAAVFRVDEVRAGRIPLPIGVVMRLLARTGATRDVSFLDPDTGDVRLQLSELGDGLEGATLHDLSVRDGLLRFEASR